MPTEVVEPLLHQFKTYILEHISRRVYNTYIIIIIIQVCCCCIPHSDVIFIGITNNKRTMLVCQLLSMLSSVMSDIPVFFSKGSCFTVGPDIDTECWPQMLIVTTQTTSASADFSSQWLIIDFTCACGGFEFDQSPGGFLRQIVQNICCSWNGVFLGKTRTRHCFECVMLVTTNVRVLIHYVSEHQ